MMAPSIQSQSQSQPQAQLQPQPQPQPQPQQQQQQHMQAAPFLYKPYTPTIPFNRRWHLAKVVLRVWSFVFAFTVLMLDIVLIMKSNEMLSQYSMYDAYELAFSLWVGSLPAAILVIGWNTAEFITLFSRRKTSGRGIHPGAHVGMDLFLWLLLIIVWGLFTAMITVEYWYMYDTTSDFYDPLVRRIGATIIVLLVLLSLIHFFLFVRACIETNQRNKMRRDAIMVYPQPGAGQHPFYNFGNQPTWFPSNPVGMGHNMAHPQAFQPMAQAFSPIPNVGVPAQAHICSHPDHQQSQPQLQNPHFSGFYAPQNAQPHMSGYYAPNMARSLEETLPVNSQPIAAPRPVPSRQEPAQAESSSDLKITAIP